MPSNSGDSPSPAVNIVAVVNPYLRERRLREQEKEQQRRSRSGEGVEQQLHQQQREERRNQRPTLQKLVPGGWEGEESSAEAQQETVAATKERDRARESEERQRKQQEWNDSGDHNGGDEGSHLRRSQRVLCKGRSKAGGHQCGHNDDKKDDHNKKDEDDEDHESRGHQKPPTRLQNSSRGPMTRSKRRYAVAETPLEAMEGGCTPSASTLVDSVMEVGDDFVVGRKATKRYRWQGYLDGGDELRKPPSPHQGQEQCKGPPSRAAAENDTLVGGSTIEEDETDGNEVDANDVDNNDVKEDDEDDEVEDDDVEDDDNNNTGSSKKLTVAATDDSEEDTACNLAQESVGESPQREDEPPPQPSRSRVGGLRPRRAIKSDGADAVAVAAPHRRGKVPAGTTTAVATDDEDKKRHSAKDGNRAEVGVKGEGSIDEPIVISYHTDASIYPDPAPHPRRTAFESFPEKLHRMLEHCQGSSGVRGSDIASFARHGRAFAIHDPDRFVRRVMPRFYRKVPDFESFLRGLRGYGFLRMRKDEPERGFSYYYHPLFLKGRVGLSVNMRREEGKKANIPNYKDPDFSFYPPIVTKPGQGWQRRHIVVKNEATLYSDQSVHPDPEPPGSESFPRKFHSALSFCEERGWDHIAFFFPHGRAFCIRKRDQFINEVIPRFFGKQRWRNVQCQLYRYGFRYITQGLDRGGYYHEAFLRGRPGLSVTIKPVHKNARRVERQGSSQADKPSPPNFYSYPPIKDTTAMAANARGVARAMSPANGLDTERQLQDPGPGTSIAQSSLCFNMSRDPAKKGLQGKSNARKPTPPNFYPYLSIPKRRNKKKGTSAPASSESASTATMLLVDAGASSAGSAVVGSGAIVGKTPTMSDHVGEEITRKSNGHVSAEGLCWKTKFQELAAYKLRNGNCKVPRKENKKLGGWAKYQRRLRRSNRLDQDRIELLDSIQFEWNPGRSKPEQWEERFKQLCQFKRETGHCNVPKKFAAMPSLRTWLLNQRSRRKLLDAGKPYPGITAERVAKLDSVGFAWTRGGKAAAGTQGQTVTAPSALGVPNAAPMAMGTTEASVGHVGGSGAEGVSSQKTEVLLSSRRNWTAEEETYVTCLIQHFKSGFLDIPDGASLMPFLEETLQCKRKRIFSKFTGASSITKQVSGCWIFHPAIRNRKNSRAIDSAKVELAELEKRWLHRMETQSTVEKSSLSEEPPVSPAQGVAEAISLGGDRLAPSGGTFQQNMACKALGQGLDKDTAAMRRQPQGQQHSDEKEPQLKDSQISTSAVYRADKDIKNYSLYPLPQLVVQHDIQVLQKQVNAGPRNCSALMQVLEDPSSRRELEERVGKDRAADLYRKIRSPILMSNEKMLEDMVETKIVHDDAPNFHPEHQRLQNCGRALQYPRLKWPQILVCEALVASLDAAKKTSHSHANTQDFRDIFFVAPCGYGKSLCFAVAAKISGGITLVIEPLKALIASQKRELADRKGLIVENLLTQQEALATRKHQACDRLHQLAAAADSGVFSRGTGLTDGHILFATPELLLTRASVMEAVKQLIRSGKLRLICIDEFDYIEETNAVYRQEYSTLVSKLRQCCLTAASTACVPRIPFLFLSATASTWSIKEQLAFVQPEQHQRQIQTCSREQLQQEQPCVTNSKPFLFITSRALPDNHVYVVERSISEVQVMERMLGILNQYEETTGDLPKCLIYGMTVSRCQRMKKWFLEQGKKTDIYIGARERPVAETSALPTGSNSLPCKSKVVQQSDQERAQVLQKFEDGEIQIVCATKAFGRGVHIPDVRFIFHPVAPSSLRDYVQATGRAGRDGRDAWCVLFYKQQDRAELENVLKVRQLPELQRRRILDGVDEVQRYCMDGSQCRYSFLAASSVVPKAQPWKQECKAATACDNCRIKNGWIAPLGSHIFQQEKEAAAVEGGKGNCISPIPPKDSATAGTAKSILPRFPNPHCAITEQLDVTFVVQMLFERLIMVQQEDLDGSSSTGANGNDGKVRHRLEDQLAFWQSEARVISSLWKEACTEHSVLQLLDRKRRESLIDVLMRYVLLQQYLPFSCQKAPLPQMNRDVMAFACGDDSVSRQERVDRLKDVIADMEQGNIKFFLRYHDVLLDAVRQKQTLEQLHGRSSNEKSKVEDLEEEMPHRTRARVLGSQMEEDKIAVNGISEKGLGMDDRFCEQLPYVVHYEMNRLATEHAATRDFRSNLSNALRKGIVPACQLIHKLSGRACKAEERFCNILKEKATQGTSNFYSDYRQLYYRAVLEELGRIKQELPQEAQSRRIYHMEGLFADRFLEVACSSNISKDEVKKFLDAPLNFCGRHFRYFWCKKEKNPQAYIMFAENGIGIAKKDELSVQELRDRCIPNQLNPEMTLGKCAKRMKLSFSGAKPTLVLPPGSVHIVPNFGVEGVVEIDGCGLLSRDALEKIWKEFIRESRTFADGSEDGNMDLYCPYSGFQGRLGGFKGAWVLDEALGGLGEGIVVHCRSSQQKYCSWQECLATKGSQRPPPPPDPPHGANVESYYYTHNDTMYINSWDTKDDTKLDIRRIQILEHLGVPYSFFRDCLERGVKQLNDFSGEGAAAWLQFLKPVNARQACGGLIDADTSTDTRKVYKMAAAGVDTNDPEFCRRTSRLVNKWFAKTRDKARYPIEQSCGLRMYCDHTLLLEEGEAFLALGASETGGMGASSASLSCAKEVVVMREPSYFPGDLRRLKLVDQRTLFQRLTRKDPPGFSEPQLKRTPTEKFVFFHNLKNALVLSNKGNRSEADRMSGGDYDGDKAWVCWNPQLLGHLTKEIPAEDYACLKTRKSKSEQANAWTASFAEEHNYMLHFRPHNLHLCGLATLHDCCIDKFGFNDTRTRELGRAAHLQVDMPFYQYQMAEGLDMARIRAMVGIPHWKGGESNGVYHSKKILGQLYDEMTDCMEKAANASGRNTSSSREDRKLESKVQAIIHNAVKQNSAFVSHLSGQMKAAADEYQHEKKKYCMNAKLFADDSEGADAYNEWRRRYSCRQRKELIEIHENFLSDGRQLPAALLYQECLKLENKKKECHAVEFAWDVAEPELLLISKGNEGALVVTLQMEKEWSKPSPFHGRF